MPQRLTGGSEPSPPPRRAEPDKPPPRTRRIARALRRARFPEDPVITVAGFTITRAEWEELDDESVALLLDALADEHHARRR